MVIIAVVILLLLLLSGGGGGGGSPDVAATLLLEEEEENGVEIIEDFSGSSLSFKAGPIKETATPSGCVVNTRRRVTYGCKENEKENWKPYFFGKPPDMAAVQFCQKRC